MLPELDSEVEDLPLAAGERTAALNLLCVWACSALLLLFSILVG